MTLTYKEPKKLVIKTLEGPSAIVEAQYNPKEISVDKSVPWSKHDEPQGDAPTLEFTTADNRSISFELFFDYLEDGGWGKLQEKIKSLETMTLIKPGSEGEEKHPPMVLVVFGMGDWITGVVESLGIKYTMFDATGCPVRATCSVKIKETNKAQTKEKTG
jgi:hypothetical protein